MKIIICKNYEEVSREAFKLVKEVLQKDRPILGLATGSSPVGLYKKMIADHHRNGTSYQSVITFNLDEYIGLPQKHEQSYYSFMHENLFDGIDIKEENTHIPFGENKEGIEEECLRYEEELKQYEIDVQILGIGSDGHIAFNEPGTPFDSLTHVVKLEGQTRKDNARFFDDNIHLVPTHAITQGLESIMRAKKIVLIATGENKADAVYAMIRGEINIDCPASILRKHEDVTILLDEAAAKRLEINETNE
ncbi:MAG: glucosamine-6-phosphate deaminase [Solobacterium sp.]|nr:glucosamine-6-phosphate deaminase [Solobacterium sp.]